MDHKNDLQLHTQWGHLNVTYRDSDFDGRSTRTAGSRGRIKRHASDTKATRDAPPKRVTVCRHESERRPTLAAKNSSNPVLSGGLSATSPYSRTGMPVTRHESDLRKKKVAFADTPPTVMNDSPPPEFRAVSYQNCGAAPRNEAIEDDPTKTRKTSSRTESEKKEKEPLTPKERRRRKVVMAVICTTFILLAASALFVLITLFNASAIDEAVRKENENMLQSTNSISGVEANSSISTTMTSISTIINALEEIHVNSSTAATTTTTT